MAPTQSASPSPAEHVQRQLMGADDAAPTLARQLPPVSAHCTRVYLCRHGQTDFNLQRKLQGRGVDMALNEEGVLQANYLARSMQNVPLRAIYSSSLRRAADTAHIVAQCHPKLRVEGFTELQEMSFGQLEGKKFEDLEDQKLAIFRQWEHGNFRASFPEGECPMDVVARGFAKIDALVKATSPQDEILVVTHGRFNKIVLAQMLHGALTHMQEIKQENTCVNVVDFDHQAQQYLPVALNNVSHLPYSSAALAI